MNRRLLGWTLAALVFFATVYVVRIREDMVDFQVNHRAAQRLVAGETLYQTGDGHFMFKYFPFAATLYVPLTLVPFEAAKALWYAFSVTGAIGMFLLAARLVSNGEAKPWWFYVVPPLVLAKFCFRELKLGQINLFLTVLFLVMVSLLVVRPSARRALGAGAVWGMATALKPYGFIFFPYFLVKGEWRALASGLAVLAFAFVAPSVFYGFEKNVEVHRDWFVTLADSTPAQLASADNVSLAGAFTKWTGDAEIASSLALAATMGLALVVVAVIVRGRRISRAEVLECGLLMTLIPLISPMGWDYQFLTAVLAITLLVDHFVELPLRQLLAVDLAVIGLTIYDLMGRAAYQAVMNASVLTLCFLIVIAYLVHLRARRIC